MTLRFVTVLALALLGIVAVPSCGGRSERDGDEPPRGGSSNGGASSGGTSGTPTGGSAGRDPVTLCRLPVSQGSCEAYIPSYWFDASTGVCMPFIYGGCEGNDNRFETLEDCYAACGGQGERDDAACTANPECVAKRLAEPCCTTNLREFVGVNVRAEFECSDRTFGCDAACAADCDSLPEDGYIGATCTSGHCVPFDARLLGLDACTTDADCALSYGVGCCSNDCCSPGFCTGCLNEGCTARAGSKLVAMGPSRTLASLVCDPDWTCPDVDVCHYLSDRFAACVSGRCTIVTTPPGP